MISEWPPCLTFSQPHTDIKWSKLSSSFNGVNMNKTNVIKIQSHVVRIKVKKKKTVMYAEDSDRREVQVMAQYLLYQLKSSQLTPSSWYSLRTFPLLYSLDSSSFFHEAAGGLG